MENWRIRYDIPKGDQKTALDPKFGNKMSYNQNIQANHYRNKIKFILWGKENNSDDSMYSDPFARIQYDYPDDIGQWMYQLNELKSSEIAQRSQKSNRVSDQLMEYGHIAFRKQNWNDALNLYSRALCFAERDTLYEGLAHGNRALCFFQTGMYHRAIVDFGLAAQKKCPEQFLANVQVTRAECQKLVKKHNGTNQRVPKLKLAAHKKFPGMASVLEIQRNKDFGRCIIAKRDIEVGQTVFVAESFVSAVTTDKQVYCHTCLKTDTNLIPCKHCSDVMFCGDDCSNWNSLHKLECQTSYHQIDDIGLKFAIQTLLVVIEMFPDIESLMQFVEKIIVDKTFHKIPKTSGDQHSKYGIFLSLTQSFKDEHVCQAYKAFTCISLLPKISYLFDTEKKQRFLMHLLLHHAIVTPKNAFVDCAHVDNQRTTLKYVFDALSIMNHSCSPNLSFTTMGKYGYCVSVRPIKKGDQMFINYLGDDAHQTFDMRQKILKDVWGFECKCDKCESSPCPVEYEQMKNDPALKYVIRTQEHDQNTNDASKRIQLKKQCIKFLKKYGHLPWSNELEFVINCFTSL